MSSVLALDYGTKQIGLALSNSQQKLAFPYGIVENRGFDFVFKEIEKICQKENVSVIIIGLPLGLSSQTTETTKKILKFIKKLKKAIKIKNPAGQKISLTLEEERLSSKMAQKLLKGSKIKKPDHSLAAMLILENYLIKNLKQNLKQK